MFTGALDGSEVQAGVEIVPREWLPVQDFPSGIFMTSLPFPAAMPEVGGKREEIHRSKLRIKMSYEEDPAQKPQKEKLLWVKEKQESLVDCKTSNDSSHGG